MTDDRELRGHRVAPWFAFHPPLIAREPQRRDGVSHRFDDSPGDRAADCGSLMEPIAISVRGDGEWVIVHRCTGCDALHLNRAAGDDNPLLLLRLAVKPLAQPPFPIELIAQL